MDNFDSLSEAIEKLKGHGFEDNFNFKDGRMQSSSGKSYGVDQLKIHHVIRFEGESNPDDMSILYALEANDGVRGLLVNSFGIYSDKNIAAFMKQLEDQHKHHTGLE